MKAFFGFFALFVLLLAQPPAEAGSIAPLGTLLSRKYPELTDQEKVLILISFTDKGSSRQVSSYSARELITEQAIRRRLKVKSASQLIDEKDLPLEKTYVDFVSTHVTEVRHQLKWFNALSAQATKAQIDFLRQYPFIREIELVGRWSKNMTPEIPVESSGPVKTQETRTVSSLNYGPSFTQINLINIIPVHDRGIHGQGVTIGVFDNGVRLQTHEAFDSMNIIAQHDFVDHKVSVVPDDPSPSFGGHGVNTLSTIGGFKPGQLIGPAFKANFILARTENDSSETPIEEDNWAAAIEWAESLGVEVTSTSLGYLTYDPPYTSWTWQDMNGNTTLITKAGDQATHEGVVVVNAAGNSGYNASHNTLGAPADGDSIITAGATDGSGLRVSFSSVGPTTDVPPRFKPDIMAMGQGVWVASATNTTGYGSASGTSFACPLSAGVAALVLCANPTLQPMQVREAMRQTANNAASPDNLVGWGLLNADSAIRYYGILPIGKIQGTCFYDLNANGVRDAGEGAVAGVTIRLSGTMNLTTLTDPSGNYVFDSLAIGDYVVSESLAAGYGQSVPESSYTLHLLHGQVAAGLDFGRYGYSSVSGNVFNDQNMNGTRDFGEPGLADWTLNLSGAFVAETASDSSGNYTFSNLPPGSYALSENPMPGWLRSAPGGKGIYNFALRNGVDTSGFDFGNYYAPTANYPVVGGWNLLSLPDSVDNYSVKSIYPSAVSDAFTYYRTYSVEDTLANGIGYWLKFAAPENIHIPGSPRQAEVVDVRAGWNIIGSLFTPAPVSMIQQIPSGIVVSSYFAYDGSYHTADTLFPHHGYWVKVNADGQLAVYGTAIPPSEGAGRPKPKPSKASGATPGGSLLPDRSRPSKR